MAAKPVPATTKITRTVEVSFEWARLLEILRRECGAPADAIVSINQYEDSTVTWSTVEVVQ